MAMFEAALGALAALHASSRHTAALPAARPLSAAGTSLLREEAASIGMFSVDLGQSWDFTGVVVVE